jgi:hypothetical protein
MARLWSSGFELNSITANVEWTAALSTPSIQTTTVRSGAYALQINSLASATLKGLRYQYAAANLTARNNYYRVYVRFDTLPSAENGFIAIANDLSSTNFVKITIDNSGVVRCYTHNGTSFSQVTGTVTLSTGIWYRLEFNVNNTPAVGSQVFTARVDGTDFCTSSTITYGRSHSNLLVGGNLFSEAQTTGNWFFDDIAINDNSGSDQASWAGAGSIVHLRPNAAGDNNALLDTAAAAGTTNNYTLVDEVTPNDVTDYVQRRSGQPIDDYNVTNSSTAGIGASDTITLVQVGARMNCISNTASADRTWTLRIKKTSGGTVAASGTIAANAITWFTNSIAAPKNYPLTRYTNPDGAAWTTSTVDTMQIGAQLPTSSTAEVHLSTLWALVEYVPYTAPVTPTFNALALAGD